MRILDNDIRYKLHTEIADVFDQNTLIVDEMSICQGTARVDIAAINGKLHGYEIKSEADTLNRLPSQIESYNRVFDTMTIICSSGHTKKIRKLIPSWWGIMEVRKRKNDFYLKPLRKTKQNKDIDSLAIAQLLWRNEALDILKKEGLQKGCLSKPKYILWDRIAEQIELSNLQDYVKATLKNRSNWKVG